MYSEKDAQYIDINRAPNDLNKYLATSYLSPKKKLCLILMHVMLKRVHTDYPLVTGTFNQMRASQHDAL